MRMLLQITKIKILQLTSTVIMKREKVNVILNVFVTKYKISNLSCIIIKIVKKCCAINCQGNYTKDKQGKVFRQYQKI